MSRTHRHNALFLVFNNNNDKEQLNSVHVIPYNGNNPQKKMFANWQLFLIHEKTFANGDKPSRIYSFLVQLPISPLATPIFPTKVATVEALQSSMCQCSSYNGHTHLQLLNRIILPKHSNTAVEYSARAYDCSLKTSNLICTGTLTEVRQASVRSLHYG